MTKADLRARKGAPRSQGGARGRGVHFAACTALLLVFVLLGAASSARAGEGEWSFEIEPIFMDVFGHDQHVLTIREIDLDAAPALDSQTAVTLDTDDDLAYRGQMEYVREKWGWGVSFFWFVSPQKVDSRTAAADGGVDEVIFEIPDQSFTSSAPGEVLFYDALEDTTLSAWMLDLYAVRSLAETSKSRLDLQFGLKFADFDNDYRAVAGIQNVGGTRLDASSNYGRMTGPLVALSGEVQFGKSTITGYIGQSVVLGEAELSNRKRDFTGPFGDMPAFFDAEVFRNTQDVAIPISELRLKWSYQLTRHFSLGVGANTSAWWDIPVPPGVIPAPNGNQVIHENTLVFFGVLAAVEWRF